MLVAIRVLEQGDGHRGHAQDLGRAMRLDAGEVERRVERRLRDDGAGRHGGGEQPLDVAEHVVAGQREQDAPAVFEGPGERRGVRGPQDVVVRDHHPLGGSRRA